MTAFTITDSTLFLNSSCLEICRILPNGEVVVYLHEPEHVAQIARIAHKAHQDLEKLRKKMLALEVKSGIIRGKIDSS